MNVYRITRTRLVTEVFRVLAETEDDAFDRLSDPDESVDQLSESTHASEASIEFIEEY